MRGGREGGREGGRKGERREGIRHLYSTRRLQSSLNLTLHPTHQVPLTVALMARPRDPGGSW